jgi:hypothetical protein
MRSGGWCHVVVAAVGVVACGGEAPVSTEELLGESGTALEVRNGSNLNGSNLNGSNLNGSNLNGERLSGTLVSVDYAGAWLDWRGEWGSGREWWFGGRHEWLEAVWLEGSVFHGRARGRHFSGRDFEHARFLGHRGDGGLVELRVDALTPGTGTNQDVWRYQVSYREPSDGHWYPICRNASGQPVEAIAVAGRWDYRQGLPGLGGAKYDDPHAFTFACEGAAIAKCIHIGYKPWAHVGGRSLAAHHQACTRLIRADYCGDGTSHTVDGQWVDLFDALGVQRDTEDWTVEAAWDTEGARCFTDHNRAHAPVSCPGTPSKLPCGTAESFSTGTLLWSETP